MRKYEPPSERVSTSYVRLESSDIALIEDHPRNRRLEHRDDVINAIVATPDGEWPQDNARHRRPTGDRCELTTGHRRSRALRKRGIGKMWARVDPLMLWPGAHRVDLDGCGLR